jgi:glycerate 2-kinase
MTPREILRWSVRCRDCRSGSRLVRAANLPPDDGGRLIVIGAGKASAAMARAVEQHWSGRSMGWS